MPKYDSKTGDKISIWSFDCFVDKKNPFIMMVASDNAPDACPYILEHEIVMGNVNKDDRDYLSEID